MSVIYQPYEHYLLNQFDKINQPPRMKKYQHLFKKNHFIDCGSFCIGTQSEMIPYLLLLMSEQPRYIPTGGIGDDRRHELENIVTTLKLLEPTDLIMYAKRYHVAFPAGTGALKYYQATMSPSSLNVNPTGLLDLPYGAEAKLARIRKHHDPFLFSPSELACRVAQCL